MTTVTLFGDSVLDNFYWLKDPEHDLKADLMMMGYEVTNLAVDESRLNDVVNGCIPKDIYQKARSYPYPCNENGIVEPLKLMKPCDVAVLSIGGNDFRCNLANIFQGIDKFMSSVINSEFIRTFDSLITQLQTIAKQVIVICVYTPYLGPGSPYQLMASFKDDIYQKVRIFLQYICKRHNVALLDLSRTFNDQDRSHYGATEIEPSNFSSHCIAECIEYINKHYDGYNIYYAKNCDIKNIIKTL